MSESLGYPVPLALAYLFVAAYVARTVFISVRLPGVVGVILIGFFFSSFMQDDLLGARDVLQELAFFLVLATAGMEISLQDINLAVLVMAWVPVTVELCGIALYAILVLGETPIQALVQGTAVCALGDGLVIPKMNEFGKANPGHPLPRLIFTCAPLEAAYVLTIFGVLSGLAMARGEKEVSITVILAANALRIASTLLLGAAVGTFSGFIIPRREKVIIAGRKVFTGSTVEAFLLFIAVCLAVFGLGMNYNDGTPFLPIGFASGPAVNSELLVISTGTCFAAVANHEVLHGVEATMGGVWVFGQLILFTMLGSKTMVEPFAQFPKVFPFMMAGFICRGLAVHLCVYATCSRRSCAPGCPSCKEANQRSASADGLFCFLATLPRATIQGAIAGVPMSKHFFSKSGSSGSEVSQLIAASGKIYIPLCAICGSLILDFCGPRLLRLSIAAASRSSGQCPNAIAGEQSRYRLGWKARFRNWRNARRLDPLNQFEAYEQVDSFVTAMEEEDRGELTNQLAEQS